MKVEIWSDIGCPFCYIGKKRFEQALAQYEQAGQVDVVYRSFELDPNAPRDYGHGVHEMLASKYGMSVEQAKEMNAGVIGQARELGLAYNMDKVVLTNTFDAHRLIRLAEQHGLMQQMAERLFQAYFTDGLHVGDHAVLADLAEQVGLDRTEAERMLAGDSFGEQVRADEREAGRLQIRGVPYFVFNRRYAVSGAQSPEALLGALRKTAETEGHANA